MEKSLKQRILEMPISDDEKIAIYLRMNGGRPYVPEPYKQARVDRIVQMVDISKPECVKRLEEYRRSRDRSADLS